MMLLIGWVDKSFSIFSSSNSCTHVCVCLCVFFCVQTSSGAFFKDLWPTYGNYSWKKANSHWMSATSMSQKIPEYALYDDKFDSSLKIAISQSPTQFSEFHELFNDITFRYFDKNSFSRSKAKFKSILPSQCKYRTVEAIICVNSKRTHSIESIL